MEEEMFCTYGDFGIEDIYTTEELYEIFLRVCDEEDEGPTDEAFEMWIEEQVEDGELHPYTPDDQCEDDWEEEEEEE